MLRTLPLAFLLSISLSLFATGEKPASKESSTSSSQKTLGVRYTFNIDNAINKNTTVDSVLIILDKFDHSGAGIVKKVFYPDANNQIFIDDLPAGKYYADVYVLGLYKKHFSTVIYTKASKKNKATLQLDYRDAYTPGNVTIPAEDTSMFAYNK